MSKQRVADESAHRTQLFASQVPWFRSRLTDGRVKLTCMRRACGGSFFLDVGEYPTEQATSPCPHCFAVSRLPDPPAAPLLEP